jgi:hypothetical protein
MIHSNKAHQSDENVFLSKAYKSDNNFLSFEILFQVNLISLMAISCQMKFYFKLVPSV